jgi:hypothetical protein
MGYTFRELPYLLYRSTSLYLCIVRAVYNIVHIFFSSHFGLKFTYILQSPSL